MPMSMEFSVMDSAEKPWMSAKLSAYCCYIFFLTNFLWITLYGNKETQAKGSRGRGKRTKSEQKENRDRVL